VPLVASREGQGNTVVGGQARRGSASPLPASQEGQLKAGARQNCAPRCHPMASGRVRKGEGVHEICEHL
jgi:hypothetical protein